MATSDPRATEIRILIVDDQQMFREGIRHRLSQEADMEVVGEAASAEEALAMVPETKPDIVVLDIRLPTKSGIDVAKVVRREWPSIKILMLSGYDFDQYVRAAARAGMEGYLLKDAPQDTLVDALREIAGGGVVLPPAIASKVMRTYNGAPSATARHVEDLTSREVEVLELISQGLRNTEVAEDLSISVRTVEAHASSIMSKLGAQSRTEAVRIGFEKSILQ